MSIARRLVKLVSMDEPSPTLRHIPTSLAFVVALVLTLVVPGLTVTSWPAIISGTLAMALAIALAGVLSWTQKLDHLVIIIPFIDLLAIGAFRTGTGGVTSLFSSLIILPVVWIAATKGRRYILLAILGTSLALLMPYIFGMSAFDAPSDWLRGVVSPVVFGVAAAIINEMARQSRVQLHKSRALVEERELMLQGAEDYTARLRENEERLRAADRLTRSVLNAVTEQSVIGSDVTGLIDVWNPGATKMLGLTAAQAQGKRYVFEFHDATELETHSRNLNYPPGETVLNPGFSALVESARLGTAEVRNWTYVRADGERVQVEVAVTRRVDESDATVGYIFVATDVTQALEVARLKDEFVGLISHELRTPLSSILGYLELMRDDEESPLSDEQLQYLTVAERNAHRLLRLVGDLLFTAQVGASTFTLDSKLVDVAPIVRASVESAMPVAARAGVHVSVDVLDGAAVVNGDAVRIGQACDNLLSNAIKFTGRDGSIAIIVSIHQSNVEITITDTGMGIPVDELDKLFARFFRASTATRAAVPGVGLGLTITKAIVVAHGGELDVTSMVGVGTSFVIRLPLA
ncbi:MAG: sensor histidine kinase [Microbacteriaceae bacterium]